MLHLAFPTLVGASALVLLWALTGVARSRLLERPRTRAERILDGAGILLTLLPTLFFLVARTYSGTVDQISATGSTAASPLPGLTLWAVNGPRVLVPLLLPIVLAAAVALPPQRHLRRHIARVAAVLLALFVFLTLPSIGWFYFPATLAIALAALRRPPRGSPA